MRARARTAHHQVQAQTPYNVIWLGLYPVCLNANGTQPCIIGNHLHLSGHTL
jgi:hypothetical protein